MLMTVDELCGRLCEFTFDDTSSMEFIRRLSEHFGTDVRSMRNEIAVFKMFVVLWFVSRSALLNKRHGPQIPEKLQSTYARRVVRQQKPKEYQDFIGAVAGQRIDVYNAAYDAWYVARQAGNPELHMYDIADAFSMFCGVDPAIEHGLSMAIYEYLMKDLWFVVGEMLTSPGELA